MKKHYLLLLILVLCILPPFIQGKEKHAKLHEFLNDLSSSNHKLRGDLILFGEFKGDLSGLSFEEYLKLLEKNESESDKGISKQISKFDAHLFRAKERSFLVALYSSKLSVVLFDDSSTSFVDSVLLIDEETPVPSLSEFISRVKF